ncbi:MAG TPA: ABC transporter substrate-binding protein [Dehalococcoidia bacterium]|nr:ABC transporter substrate-binding protein [Dehalococcoidia bacterium]
MTARGYWERTRGARLARRRAIAGAAALATGAAALSLVGCGNDARKVTSDIDIAGGLGVPKDTSSIAVQGGTYKSVTNQDVQTFDVGETSNFTAYGAAPFVYSKIVKSKSVPTQPVGKEIDGDLAEKWEITSDGTQWTFRIRDAKMSPVAPLNGRAVDIEDVRLSWERFAAKNPRRNRYDMIDKFETPDSRTIVFKLKFPYGPFGKILADNSAFWVMPKEVAQGKVDYRSTAAGMGPYMLEEYKPSSHVYWKRNPNYFMQGLPYVDRWEFPIVTEYAQRLAQFKAGNIYALTPNTADIISLRQDQPNAVPYQPDFTVGWPVIFFGRTDPVFHGEKGDVRIRRALSMAIDRDLFIDTFYNVSQLQKAGFANIETRWHNMLSCGWPYWLNPQSKEMGWPDKAPGLWYKYDVKEARALLAAAGYPNGIDMDVHYATIFLAGATFRNQVEATMGFWKEAGFRITHKPEDFQTEFLPRTVEKGDMTGIAVSPSGEYNEVDTLLTSQWRLVEGAPNDRNPPGYNNPELNAMIDKQRRTLDENERTKILHDIQIWLSDRLWGIPWGGQATSGFTFYYPWIQNVQVFRGSPDSITRVWIDQTKLPS